MQYGGATWPAGELTCRSLAIGVRECSPDNLRPDENDLSNDFGGLWVSTRETQAWTAKQSVRAGLTRAGQERTEQEASRFQHPHEAAARRISLKTTRESPARGPRRASAKRTIGRQERQVKKKRQKKTL
jgi:hypothetical protein